MDDLEIELPGVASSDETMDSSEPRSSVPVAVTKRATRPASGLLAAHMGRHLGATILVRLLSAIQWDAFQLMWSGAAEPLDPLAPFLRKLAREGLASGDMAPPSRHFLMRVLGLAWMERASSWFRLLEDACVASALAWSALCAFGICKW